MLLTNTRFIPSSGGLVFGASAEVIFEGGLLQISQDFTKRFLPHRGGDPSSRVNQTHSILIETGSHQFCSL
jgi:hypothetical protein